MEHLINALKNLTHNRLRDYAGARVYSRGKGYIRDVEGLARTADNVLVAWVRGTYRYATSIKVGLEGDLIATCSCPFGGRICKHAVAVVLAGAQQVTSGNVIPLLAPDSKLAKMFDFTAMGFSPDVDGDEMEDDEFDDSADDDEEGEDEHADADENDTEDTEDSGDDIGDTGFAAKGAGSGHVRIVELLDRMSRDELLTLLADLAKKIPAVASRIIQYDGRSRSDTPLSRKKRDANITRLRQQILERTSEPSWTNSWNGEGFVPDFSDIRDALQELLDDGEADAVVSLGEDLWTYGNAQLGESNDEGELGEEIFACMQVVMEAVPHSSMPPLGQLLWIIERVMDDEYSVLGGCDHIYTNERYTQQHWKEVAREFEARMQNMPVADVEDYKYRYKRKELLSMLIYAYRLGGCEDQIIALLEKEAQHSLVYKDLVIELVKHGEVDRARHWCIKGMQETSVEHGHVAAELRSQLREIANTEQRFDLVATYRTEEFFENPSPATYFELQKAAEAAGVWTVIRPAALSYLETGLRPDVDPEASASETWPLPAPEVLLSANRRYSSQFPDLDTLVTIAIKEKRIDDVVLLHDRLPKNQFNDLSGFGLINTIAVAIAEAYPQRALDIWRIIVDKLIGKVNYEGYRSAVDYLGRMKAVYDREHRLKEWEDLLTELRTTHKRKRRFLEELNGLTDTPLVP